jgi:hypothetical protein
MSQEKGPEINTDRVRRVAGSVIEKSKAISKDIKAFESDPYFHQAADGQRGAFQVRTALSELPETTDEQLRVVDGVIDKFQKERDQQNRYRNKLTNSSDSYDREGRGDYLDNRESYEQAAIEDATAAGHTVNYGGETHEPPKQAA